MKRIITRTAVGLFFAAIIGLLAWPVVGEYISRRNINASVAEWNRQIEASDTESIRIHRNLAGWYNLNLSLEQPEDGFEEAYDSILNYENHVMCLLEIPSLGITLPVYHGVSDAILQKGVGHLPETAFPIGGEGNHAVLVGQMELPGKRLFTDASTMKAGDLFYIWVPGEVLAYRIKTVRSVQPEVVNKLLPVSGEDLCTLVAVSPQGEYSECLLIQGQRMEADRRKCW